MVSIIVIACGEPTATPNNIAQSDVCGVQSNPSPGPVLDSSGPYYHQVVIGTTTNGTFVTGARQVLDHASVPDGVRLADGRVFVYYVNGARSSVWVAQYDGQNANPIGGIVVNGKTESAGIVDPDAVLVNGKIRLFYLNGFGPPNSGVNRMICVAESADGVNFTVVDSALSMSSTELLTDPSVVRLPDGSWRMAISQGQQSVFATSSDGIHFRRLTTLTFGGVPELGLTNNGLLRIYVCSGGIVSYTSADGGTSWTRETTVISPPTTGPRIVCDPSHVPGAGLFVYKTG